MIAGCAPGGGIATRPEGIGAGSWTVHSVGQLIQNAGPRVEGSMFLAAAGEAEVAARGRVTAAETGLVGLSFLYGVSAKEQGLFTGGRVNFGDHRTSFLAPGETETTDFPATTVRTGTYDLTLLPFSCEAEYGLGCELQFGLEPARHVFGVGPIPDGILPSDDE